MGCEMTIVSADLPIIVTVLRKKAAKVVVVVEDCTEGCGCYHYFEAEHGPSLAQPVLLPPPSSKNDHHSLMILCYTVLLQRCWSGEHQRRFSLLHARTPDGLPHYSSS